MLRTFKKFLAFSTIGKNLLGRHPPDAFGLIGHFPTCTVPHSHGTLLEDARTSLGLGHQRH
jgi:hypothetical protein